MSTAKEIAIGVGTAGLVLMAVCLSTLSVIFGLYRGSSVVSDSASYTSFLGITPTLLGLVGVILLARRWTDLTARASALVASVILLPPVGAILFVVYLLVANRHAGSS